VRLAEDDTPIPALNCLAIRQSFKGRNISLMASDPQKISDFLRTSAGVVASVQIPAASMPLLIKDKGYDAVPQFQQSK